MLLCNLAVLMAERGLKIVDVYEQTGISKTTLMALSENKGKGVQFETIDRLCNSLGTTPADFFVYSPYDFVFEIKNREECNEIFNHIMDVYPKPLNNFDYFLCITSIKRYEKINYDPFFFSWDAKKKYLTIELADDFLEEIYNELHTMLQKNFINHIVDETFELLKKVKDKFNINGNIKFHIKINDGLIYKTIINI